MERGTNSLNGGCPNAAGLDGLACFTAGMCLGSSGKALLVGGCCDGLSEFDGGPAICSTNPIVKKIVILIK